MEQYGCVLLKGGKSSRMGGSDKAKLLYRGKSFEERIKGELEQLGLPVFVSEAKKSPDPRAIPDLIPEAGPLGGIYSCLKSVSYATESIILAEHSQNVFCFLRYALICILSGETHSYGSRR